MDAEKGKRVMDEEIINVYRRVMHSVVKTLLRGGMSQENLERWLIAIVRIEVTHKNRGKKESG